MSLSLACRLDRRRRGYLEALDWGTKDAFQQIQLFSTRYMQKYMGVPDMTSTPEQVTLGDMGLYGWQE